MAGMASRTSFHMYKTLSGFAHSCSKSSIRALSSINGLHHVNCRPTLAVLNTQLPCLQNKNTCKRWTSTQASEPIDAEFSQFLSEEIAREQESHKDHQEVKTVEGWTPEFKGTDVVLSKSHKNEKISVKFNIVDSVDVADDSLESEETKDVKMLSKPPFVVEIHKAGGKILTLECQFSGMDEELDTPEADQQEDVYGDKFQILEIALHDSEISSTSYSAQTSTMDASMYEMLMDMLDDRGIDDNFMDQLLNFCTDYEHAQYIKFLGDLKSFVDTK